MRSSGSMIRGAGVLATVLLSACAAAPQVEPASPAAAAFDPAPIAASAGAAPTVAEASAAAAPSTAGSAGAAASTASSTVKVARKYPGYKKRHRDGQTVYCRSETILGTRIAEELCFTEAQLEEIERRKEEVNAELRTNMSRHICGNRCSN